MCDWVYSIVLFSDGLEAILLVWNEAVDDDETTNESLMFGDVVCG